MLMLVLVVFLVRGFCVAGVTLVVAVKPTEVEFGSVIVVRPPAGWRLTTAGPPALPELGMIADCCATWPFQRTCTTTRL